MTDMPAAIEPRRTGVPERDEASAERTLAHCHVLMLLPITLGFAFVAFSTAAVLGLVSATLFSALTYSFLIFAIGIGVVFRKYLDDMDFIVNSRPFNVGDWIEVGPLATSSRLNKENFWRVEKFTLFHTELVSLASGERVSWPNRNFDNRPFRYWDSSSPPAKFAIVVQVPLGTCDGDDRLLLKQIHEKVQQYAKDNPSEWSAVEIPAANAVTFGNKDKEYCILIQHCKSYKEPDVVFDSHDKLSVYLQDLMQAGLLSNKKPVNTSGSTLSVAAGDGDEGDEVNNGVLKVDCPEGERKMDEEDEQEEGDLEGGLNENIDNDHRVKYRIFIR